MRAKAFETAILFAVAVTIADLILGYETKRIIYNAGIVSFNVYLAYCKGWNRE